MMKKMILIAAACFVMTAAAACSDDKPEVCDQQNYKTRCDGDTLLYCNTNNRVVEEECNYGCDSNMLQCKTGSTTKPVNPSNPQNPGDSGDISRPGKPQQPVETDECGSITETGTCDGNVAKRCVNKKIVTQTCTEGTTCSMRSDGHVDCVANNPQETITYKTGDPCNNIDEFGICNGKQLVYCDNNKLVTENCATKCILDDKEEYAICHQDCPQDLDGIGACFENNTIMKYCHDTKGLIVRYCSEGFTCKHYQDEQYNYYECFNDSAESIPAKPGDETMPMPKPDPQEM